MQRYKKAGARIFFALANHHDNFDAWNSKHNGWNALRTGPRRDVIGTWADEARKQGLRFGVTVHQARNWWWFQTSHGADATGNNSGVPYDGALTMAEGKGTWWQGLDPQRMYGPKHPLNALPDISFIKDFYDRTRDLIDQYDPDLLYFDNPMFPQGWGGISLGAYLYNHGLKTRSGKNEVVVNIKKVPDSLARSVVADCERGVTDGIMPYAWQSETCIGDWHYKKSLFDQQGEYGGYLHPREAIHWLIDTVSKNGTFILNIPGKPDGTIDDKEIAILDAITAWMQRNSESIYETRPWKIYGEGPHQVKGGTFQGDSMVTLGPQDIRFTRNKANTVIYVFTMGWPTADISIRSLGVSSSTSPGKIEQVTLLGTYAKLQWQQSPAGLQVVMPKGYSPAANFSAVLKIFLT